MRRTNRRGKDADVDRALDAMTADELRALVRDVLTRLDHDVPLEIPDLVLRHASRGAAGFSPAGPSPEIVTEVREFVEVARRNGEADAGDVDRYLREGRRAFYAGDYRTAREVFSTLLPPVGSADIYLGQDELVSEVLTVDEYECAVQYLVCVYVTTPSAERAEAIGRALDLMDGVGSIWSPIEEMERMASAPLPELEAFVPAWLDCLRSRPPTAGPGQRNHEQWIREAALRAQGPAGLERVARESGKPEDLDA